MSIMGLHKPGTVQITGSILLDGTELVGATPEQVRALRGKQMAMIFQDPLSAMHPFYTVGHQIIEAYRVHNDVSQVGGAQARHRHARPGRHPPAELAGRRLPAPVLRRHAPARDDRHGAVLRPRPAHRRRADHRARRHGAGADPRPDPRPAERVQLGGHHHHPRPRRRRRARRRHHGDVCRARPWSTPRRDEIFDASPAPLHLGSARLDAPPRPRAHRAAAARSRARRRA